MSDLHKDVAELADVLDQLAALRKRETELKARIRPELPLGVTNFGTHTVGLTQNRRIDGSKVAGDYPPETHPYLYSLTIDTTKVREHFDADDIEAYMVIVGADKMTVKPVKSDG